MSEIVYCELSASLKRGMVPSRFLLIMVFHNAFLSIDLTRDLGLFDIKRIKGEYIKEYFNFDSSAILKRSLYELYEDSKDKEVIENFEKDLKENNHSFVKYEKLI